MSGVRPAGTRVGWVGTGVMGSLMCGHLLESGYAMTVYTRQRSRAERLLEMGASWAASPADAAIGSDVLFTMVGTPAEVRDVVLGQDGALTAAKPGSVLIDMTTSDPSLAAEIYAVARERGVGSLDAPVSGGDLGARTATLSIMVGGDAETVERVRPLLELLGNKVVRQGGPGTGQHTKMVNQVLFASGIVGVCEALLYAYRAGLDLETVLESVAGGAGGSWALTNLGPRMLKGDYAPSFSISHYIKDLEIALTEARRFNLALPGLALAHQLYIALRAQGGVERGTQALILALAQLSDIEWRPAENTDS